jgi:hypothetical protein
MSQCKGTPDIVPTIISQRGKLELCLCCNLALWTIIMLYSLNEV